MNDALLIGLFTLAGAGVGAIASYLGASSGARRAESDDVREAARLLAADLRVSARTLRHAGDADLAVMVRLTPERLPTHAWDRYKPILARRVRNKSLWETIEMAGKELQLFEGFSRNANLELKSEENNWRFFLHLATSRLEDGANALDRAQKRRPYFPRR